MCIAIPSRVVEISGLAAVVECYGVQRQVNLMLLDDVELGDYVIVQAGFALEKLSAESSEAALRLFDELMADGLIDDKGISD